jgi:hypothetical protein
LSDDERGVCQEIIKNLTGSSQKFRRAQMLLKADAEGPGWPEVRIAEAFNCREPTIEPLRNRLVTAGVGWALEGKRRREPPTPCKHDGEAEATWITMRLGKPPAGYGRWPLPRLADELVAWEIVAAIRHETICQVLKKRHDEAEDCLLVIPPEQDAECVACMEEGLETYAAYDPQHPVLCMDEQPIQLLQETRAPIAATQKYGKRVDYAYERNGTASVFMFAEPLSGFRPATARVRRTKADWAIEVAQMLDTRYADGEQVTLVCDNLNTHTKGTFYEAFAPERARACIKHINFCYTPKHGSGLNVAECELSCLTSHCLHDRRIGALTELQTEIALWSEKTNAKQCGVDWQSRIENARVKLKRLYPKIKA